VDTIGSEVVGTDLPMNLLFDERKINFMRQLKSAKKVLKFLFRRQMLCILHCLLREMIKNSLLTPCGKCYK
jgi:hypothetical protein